MESLHSRKLSNATTFSSKTPYAGVFSAHRHSYAGASTIDAQDYREIFGSSPAATSIPVLDLSTLGVGEASDGFNLKFRSSKPDYSKIFGGFRDEDVAVSYEELFASDKARAPSSTTSSSSPDSDNLSHQSSDALKQFNMSYNKISPKSKDGLDGNTRHVTKLHAIPGFTRFIDEEVPPLMETEKHEDSSKNSKHGESFSEDKFSKKVHPAKISPPSASPTNVIDHKDYPKRSTAKNSESCKTDTSEQGDEELDVNSAASALKKAIEKAQESIRIAKESVGRKKKGLRSSSSKTFKDSLKVEEHKYRDEVRASSQVEGRNRTVVFPDFMNGEKLSGAKKVMDEIHEKFSESNKECLISVESSEKDETEIRPLDSDEKDESATFSSETVDTEKNKTAPSDFLHTDQTDNMSEDYKSKIKEFEGPQEDEASVQRLEDFQDSEETIEVDMSKESEEVKDEVISSNTHELVDESINLTMSEKVEDEEKASEEEILEQEHIENAENATESIQESEKSAESCDDKLEESEVSVMKHEDCDQELEKTSIDQTSSEENEDEQETEENDVESESSSSREEEEESNNTNNTQLPHKQIPEMEVNEETHKEMERKKERLAVERAIREARERARERSERAAVEKATQEIRQRMMADAQQKAAKASAQSKLRAERAAVERATSEARQRALMKAISQKNETTVLNGISSESALRSKAKLEKHNRIMERAAKALAEKEKRDLLAQKEQAERNRLAENLDADIKRWSNGKEGNLRALLSTLQYILGSQSGWEAVSLTEIVATSAVKKAYRKATLCVHPDKLQQRGASIQHKYICEKVFDLLKAAWNKFNSEER